MSTTEDMRAQIVSLKGELAEEDERIRVLKEEVRTHRSIHPQVDAVMSQFGDATTADEETRTRWRKETAKKRRAQWLELLQAETAPRRHKDTGIAAWAGTVISTLLLWSVAIGMVGVGVQSLWNMVAFWTLVN